MKGAPARAIFEVLRAWGADVVFTTPGSTEAAFLDASTGAPDVHLVLTTHEAVAIAAADGYARASGRPAVAYLHANVGLANGVAHLSAAHLAHAPVVVLNGLKSTAIANRGGFTTAPYPRDEVRQYVRWARVARQPEAVAEELTRALAVATTEPGGPVYLGIPQDVLESEIVSPVPDARRHRIGPRRADPAAVAAAAALLDGARAVAIVAGGEIVRGGATAALLALADRLDAALLLEDRRTIQDAGLAADHPRYAGTYAPGNAAVAGAAAIVFAGCTSLVEFEPPRGPAIPAGAAVVHLSADAAEIGKVDGVDVALAGDARLVLADLLAALPGGGEDAPAARRRHVQQAVAAHRTAAAARRERARGRLADIPVAVEALALALDEALPRDAIVIGDPVTSGADVLETIVGDSARRYHTTASGSLGWGMCAPIGFALALRRPVVAIVGDGVFQFGVQALATAAALTLPIVYVVIDNASYAAVRAALKRYRGSPDGPFPASDLAGPDLAAIARGFGLAAVRVDALAELPAALAAAHAHAGPSAVVVRTDPLHTGPP